MICFKLPELAAWPAKGACEAAAFGSSCAVTSRIEGRNIRRIIADFVIMFPPCSCCELLRRNFLFGFRKLYTQPPAAKRAAAAEDVERARRIDGRARDHLVERHAQHQELRHDVREVD